MSASGDIYGVVLNDSAERSALVEQFDVPPYAAPPRAPVVYMKPRSAIAAGIVARRDGPVVCAATLALLIARDAARRSRADALACVGAVALAIDLSSPEANYYRPAVAQRNADASLVLGDWVAPVFPRRIATSLDGAALHDWTLDRLARSPAALLAALSDFMTLRAGDVLLVGLPGDAPVLAEGGAIRVEADGMPPLSVRLG